ncbi:MAG: acetate kinase, partial [Thiolinea sp.]
ALAEQHPGLPQVACFDTAFHASQPAVATRLPIPQHYHDQGIRRYGFHGLSYEYIVSELQQAEGGIPAKTLVAHLGNGASLCAMQAGKSVATSMGFSTLDGLLMGTRCGMIDPGVLLHWLREGRGEPELTDLLYNQCGLKGVSGLSSDMRILLASDEPAAKLAVDQFCYSLQRQIGSHAAALEGLECLVFTGGIGEHAAPVREQVCAHLQWLGVRLDDEANRQNARLISTPDSQVRVQVIPANEELVIARHTLETLA